MAERAPLLQLLDTALDRGGLQTDDVLAVIGPLLREVVTLHENGLVAALDGPYAYAVNEGGTLTLRRPQGTHPVSNRPELERLQVPVSSVLHLVGDVQLTNTSESGVEVRDLGVAQGDEARLERPAYLPGYIAWENRVGHHDPLSDILCLGQVLATLACGVDLTSPEDLRLFASQRENLFRINERLHPVMAAVIVEMTELERPRRTQDLASVIRRLESYRDQPRRPTLDSALIGQDSASGKRRAIQTRLRDRLFDLSRRNRMLYFRPTNSTVNLTVASVPLVMDIKNIRIDQLCVWGGDFASEVLVGEKLTLGRWLRFEDQPYLPGSLDQIIQESRRDRAEYGFSQLSLVIAFLRWHNLKEFREERITTPLLLLPVELSRKKGVRDQYLVQAESGEAEINPVLRHQLHELYGIELPDSIDLRTSTAADFFESLKAQIAATEPGVQLRLQTQPQIELVHQRATQRLEQFRRRQAARLPEVVSRTVDFSYSADDFRPLGLRLFHERVRAEPLPLREAIGGPVAPRHPLMAATDAAERLTFALSERKGNPFVWDFDLTNVTLGNFNYRKMSLVRDYNALVEADMPNAAFDRVFSLLPRTLEDVIPAPLPLQSSWPVVTADATQTAAVALARSGVSYIIQGPPGTGKSQTITNLVADYVGQGKRVLFVCEKRAAIDVVFHRLRQQGLDELCCMIHDSQADKKAFVMNLKQTYEHWSANEDGLEEVQRKRKAMIRGIDNDLQALARFDEAMRSAPEHVGTTLRKLIHRIVELREHAHDLDALQREALPEFTAWQTHADLAERLERALSETAGVNSLAQHAFAHLADALIAQDRPLARLTELTDRCEELLDRCEDRRARAWAQGPALAWSEVRRIAAEARLLATLARKGHMSLLAGGSDASAQLESAADHLVKLARAHATAESKTSNWRDKLPPADARAALDGARGTERSLFRVLMPSWWRLRKLLDQRYDFTRHAVRPAMTSILSELVAEHDARAALDEARGALTERYGADDAEAFIAAVRETRSAAAQHMALAGLHQHLMKTADARAAVEELNNMAESLAVLEPLLNELLVNPGPQTLDALGELIRDLRENSDSLTELLPLLRELIEAEPAVARALRTLPLRCAAIEHAVALENLERVHARERWLSRFDAATLVRHATRVARADQELLALNAHNMRAAVRRRFRENSQRALLAASQLDTSGKLFKKTYSAGRRELEHEFGKTMRFKSIRELASANSGQVVRDMKPVWLMSPLSVSDTLPLAPDLFDVVIFDEASQIPVEEAVPALYRAPQVIVVGDEMQLPPTDFFSASGGDDEDTLELEDEGERFSITLDADSLLHQGARNLPATLLAWHYRSRYECLIGYSNAAFYGGNLYTIPDRSIPGASLTDIAVPPGEMSEQIASANADALLARAVSFHSTAGSPYINRRNPGEADYIARLVRALLRRETGRSIGIVAFSEAQQTQIESALNDLGKSDAEFAARLDAEMTREEDDQFCGLFVKNLENVQGDERDIIILSICYGPGPDGRMLMNFGPINQRGGEKRLNVIFSRARHHMAVVSSIRHDSITNDNNTGAAALKHFLRYADHLSGGRVRAAHQVLQGLNALSRSALSGDENPDAVVEQISAALRARGHVVDQQVGQSRFRCDLAVREASQERYSLGILIDTANHYLGRDVFERYVSRPRILQTFGWNVERVLSCDWLHDPEGVLRRLERALKRAPGEKDQAAAEADEAVAAAVAEAAASIESETLAQAPAEPESAPRPARDPVPVPAPADNMRRFEFTEGDSRKFWQIGRTGSDVTVSWGRIGTKGQLQIKQLGDEARAERELQKLIGEKVRKGYIEVGPGS
jgi:predicted DNA-binding WGR domain protein